MIKRIVTYTLAFLIVIMPVLTTKAENLQDGTLSVKEFTKAEKFFDGIDVIDGEKYIPDATITRGDFAEFLVRMAAWKQGTSETVFADVPTDHVNYDAVQTVHAYGLMGGVGNNLFAPEYHIVLNQAVKVLVELMGYAPHAKREGGYPNGYVAVANKLNLLQNVSGKFTDDATYRDILQLFYNALEVPVQEITGMKEGHVVHGPGETFAEAVLKLKKIEGRVTDNGLTSITGTSKVTRQKMVVAGAEVDLTEETQYARDYIGLDVDAYYRTDAETEKPLAYAEPDKNDCITFNLSDFVSITQTAITYYDEDKLVTKRLHGGFTMLYNGAVFDPVIPSALEGISGEVTLISTNQSAYDLIVVDAYEHVFAEAVDKAEKIIYNGIRFKAGQNGLHMLDFSDERTYDYLNVVTYDGRPSSFDKIREGDVISAKISRDGRMITLIVEREFTETFVLDTYEVTKDICTISDGENRYEIPRFDKLLFPDLVRGQNYTVHFNIFGEVVWMEKTESQYPIAFLAGAEEDRNSLAKDFKVRLYTQDGEFLNLKVDEKVYYNHFNKKTEDIFEELSSYVGSAVLYEADEGVLLKIVMPEELGVDSGRGWYRISPVAYGCQSDAGLNDADWEKHKTQIWSDVGESRHVGDKFAFVNGTSIGMYVPAECARYSDETGYGIFKNSPKSYTKKAIEGYSREFQDVVADLQLTKVDGAGISATEMNMILISEITTRMNEEGEIEKVIAGYKTSYGANGVSKVSYPVSENAVVSGCGMQKIDDVSKGDIMMYSLNGAEKLLTLEMFYDYSTGRSESMLHNSYHVDKGYVYANGDNWTRTTSILPEELDMTKTEDYIQTVGRNHIYPNALIIVTKAGDRLLFETASVSDLKSYTKTYGAYDYLVTLSNGSESIFGSVAYR